MAEIGIQARQAVDSETGDKVPYLVEGRSRPTSNGAGSGTDEDPYTYDVTLADGSVEHHSVVFLDNGLVKSDTFTTTPAP